MTDSSNSETTVACPECGTRYRAPGGILGGPGTTYRCARCGHVFSVTPPSPRSDRPARASDAVSLSEGDETEPEAAASVMPGESRPDADAPAFVRGEAALEDEEEEIDLPPEPAFMAAAKPDAAEDSMAAQRSASWFRTGVRFETIVLVGFCALGLYLAAHPQETVRLLAQMPVVGSTVGAPGYLLDGLTLIGLEGAPEQLKGRRSAFIIAGQVLNNSTRSVGAVQIEGQLYDETGTVARRKTVYAGTKVSRRLVKNWTPTAIEMLEKIKPPKRHTLAPGGTDDFLIIFQDVPPAITEFGCGVVAAEPVAGG